LPYLIGCGDQQDKHWRRKSFFVMYLEKNYKMIQFKTLLIVFFAFISVPIFAQIAKGNYNFNGTADLSANLTTYPQQPILPRILVANASINPSVSKFITNKWLVGLQPNLSIGTTQRGTSTIAVYSAQNSTLGLGVISRYYFGNIRNTHFFGFAGLDIAQGHFEPKNFVRDSKSKLNQFSYSVGFGANIFLNSEVALEPTISYSSYQNTYKQTGNGTSSVVIINYISFSTGVQLNNFLKFSTKTDTKEPARYIGKNRRILGGRTYLDFNGNYGADIKFNFAPQFSQFITPRIMLKGALDFSVISQVSQFQFFQTWLRFDMLFNTGVAARYYVPFGKRFFIYPELNSSYSLGRSSRYFGTNNNTPTKILTAGLSIGGSYFLSENIALDMSFVQARFSFDGPPNRNTSGLLGIGNIGLLYFIR
jgi:hypothetical protein